MIHFITSLNPDLKHSEHWSKTIPEYLISQGLEINVINGDVKIPYENSPLWDLYYKNSTYKKLYLDFIGGKIKDNDTIFFSDAWNPTLIYTKLMTDMFSYRVFYVGYWNDSIRDKTSKLFLYMSKPEKRWAKMVEKLVYQINDYNLFQNDYSVRFNSLKKTVNKNIVIGYPIGNIFDNVQVDLSVKKNIVMYVADRYDDGQHRYFTQLQNFMPEYQFINAADLSLDRDGYYELLKSVKVVIAFNLYGTDMFQIYEAMKFGCVPITPDSAVYKNYLFDEFKIDAEAITPNRINFVRYHNIIHSKVSDSINNYEMKINVVNENLKVLEATTFNNDGLLRTFEEIKNHKKRIHDKFTRGSRIKFANRSKKRGNFEV